MKRSLLFVSLLAATLSFTACDYSNGPGKEAQRESTFSEAPEARATDSDLDSVNSKQTVTSPQGLGSAADQSAEGQQSRNGAVNAPGGDTPPAPNGSNSN